MFRTILFGLLFILLVLLNGCHDNADSKPTIISISPNKAPVGKLVTITGANFSGVSSSDNTVEFNGVLAPVSNSTATTLQVKVPKGAMTGKIFVTVKGKGKTQSPSDFIVDDCSSCGFVEKFSLSNDYNCSIEPINATRLNDNLMSPSKRGFNFIVNKKIRVKAIGGLFRSAGSYPIELYNMYGISVIYATTISANDTENFVFKEVDTDIQLIPGVEYILRYCSENNNSVYDLSSPSGSFSSWGGHDFGDVRLTTLSYSSYISDCSDRGNIGGWASTAIFMRGIVDFKYEIIQ